MIIDASSPAGNAFNIMGVVQQYLRQSGQADKIDEVLARMRSGDYNNLCDVAEEVTYGVVQITGR